MTFEMVQVDAFTQQVFGGNSAAVIVVEHWPPAPLMQQIAMENNLSETVFVMPDNDSWFIRWFTPQTEVDLCGHATLAAAHVLFKDGHVKGRRLNLQSQSGALAVDCKAKRNANREAICEDSGDDLLFLDFPSRPGTPIRNLEACEAAIGQKVVAGFQSRDTLLVLDSQAQVLDCRPDMQALAALDTFAVMVSAPGEDCDFVSRFFAPAAGIPEDPVTGSAHCTLIPYWAERLGKTDLHARQLSARGGELFCTLAGDRVRIGGYCVEYMRGRLSAGVLAAGMRPEEQGGKSREGIAGKTVS